MRGQRPAPLIPAVQVASIEYRRADLRATQVMQIVRRGPLGYGKALPSRHACPPGADDERLRVGVGMAAWGRPP